MLDWMREVSQIKNYLAEEINMLGQNLLRILKERKLSIMALAKMSGVPKSTIHAWTVGQQTVNLNQVKNVSNALEVGLHELIFGFKDPFGKLISVDLDEIFNDDVRLIIKKVKK
jgi:transcriptional regulator with XRE-family HTH domain